MFETAKSYLSDIFKPGNKETPIDRDQIADWAGNTANACKAILDVLDKEPVKVLNEYRTLFDEKYASSKYKEVTCWKDYVKSLNTKGSTMEASCFLSSVMEMLKIYAKALEGIKKDITYIFPDELTNIKELRKSQIGVIACIDRGATVCNWSLYMTMLIFNVIVDSTDDIPKYRLIFIRDNTKVVAETANSVLTQGSLDFVGYAKMLRNKGLDTKMSINGILTKDAFDVPYIGAVAIPVAILFGISAILAIRRLSRYTQEYLETRNHNEYLRNKEMKEWLEAHTARLRMTLNGVNPNDPQYQKTLKIIDTYDEKIRDLDEKINSYLDS